VIEFAICAQIAITENKAQLRPVAVQRFGRTSKKNKLVNLRYLGYITAELRKIFPVVAEIRLKVSTYPRIRTAKGIAPYSTLSFFGVYALYSAKFCTDVKHPGTVYPENLTGVTAENLWRIAKIGKFVRTQIWVDL